MESTTATTAVTIYDKIEEIAAEIRSLAPGESSHDWIAITVRDWPRLEHAPTGAQVSLWCGGGLNASSPIKAGERFEFIPYWENLRGHSYKPYGSESPVSKITITASKWSGQIAKELFRRLLADYLPQAEASRKRLDEAKRYYIDTEEAAKRYAALFGATPYQHQETKFSFYQDGISLVAEVNSDVSLDLTVSRSVAERIFELLLTDQRERAAKAAASDAIKRTVGNGHEAETDLF